MRTSAPAIFTQSSFGRTTCRALCVGLTIFFQNLDLNYLGRSYTRGRLQLERSLMPQRTVKGFNAQKGFGFIQPDDGSRDVFVHISAVERAGLNDLRDGQQVTYDIVADRRTGRSSADNLKVT